MLRPSLIMCLFLAAAGCGHQKPPGVDPFFGRTTVPSPPTGAASPQATDPYYRNPPTFPTPNAGTGSTINRPADNGATGPAPASAISNPVGGWGARSISAGSQVRPSAESNSAGSTPGTFFSGGSSLGGGTALGSGPSLGSGASLGGGSARVAEPIGAIRTNDASAASNRWPGSTGAAGSALGFARGSQQGPPPTAGSVLLWQSQPRVESTLPPAPSTASSPKGQTVAPSASAPTRTLQANSTATAAQPTQVVNINDLPPLGSSSGSGTSSDGTSNPSSLGGITLP